MYEHARQVWVTSQREGADDMQAYAEWNNHLNMPQPMRSPAQMLSCNQQLTAYRIFDYIVEIDRQPDHTWNGYVSVPQGHPAYFHHADHPMIKAIPVHGGITMAAGNKFGFDCNHGMTDINPKHPTQHITEERLRAIGMPPPTYKNFAFAQKHVMKLFFALRGLEGKCHCCLVLKAMTPCHQCKKVYYCDDECRLKHWNESHKDRCCT